MSNETILAVAPEREHKLLLHYANGERRRFDVTPYIRGSWYGRLNDEGYFRTVRVTRDGRGVEWPDGQDIAPHELADLSTTVPADAK